MGLAFSMVTKVDENTCRVKARSMISGVEHDLDIPMNIIDFTKAVTRYNSGEHIQTAFSQLDADLREFILTGITPEEWKKAFPEEDE